MASSLDSRMHRNGSKRWTRRGTCASAWGALIVGLAAGVPAVAAEPTFYEARIAPLFDQHCVSCHGAEKAKAELRLDSMAAIMKGSDAGHVVAPGTLSDSELFRRITLPHDDPDFMPSDGKPPMAPDEVKLVELWIARGASDEAPMSAFADAPVPRRFRKVEPLAPDWSPRAQEIVRLAKELGVKLVPRSHLRTDGLVLRTASAPASFDDADLAALAPIADLIVEAEVARTRVTDEGLKTLATFANLRAVDLTRTAVTSAGIAHLRPLEKLEALNLTDTAVDASAQPVLASLGSLKNVWHFGTALDEVVSPDGSH
jgi:hypothetical protein